MGLIQIRSEVIGRLKTGRVMHETGRSGSIDEKNLLLTGQVSVEEVIEVLNATKGMGYSTSKHHLDTKVDVHVFRATCFGKRWYIKCYFIQPDVWFISVHH